MHAQQALNEIELEFSAASRRHDPFNSAHEGFAILLEEVDELWDEVKKRDRSASRMREEAVQIGAMAARFLTDVC